MRAGTGNRERGTGRSLATWIAFVWLGALVAGAQGQQVTTATVAMRDFSFEPHEVSIAAGTAVRWVNEDQAPHQIAMEGGRPGSSREIAPGQSHTFTFQQPGTYTYRCGIHPTMLGVVIVGP
ncbi:MAG: cupredoxin domain-containing protein [bacterium]